jgi:membrane protein DedA with SNARE-associated domain
MIVLVMRHSLRLLLGLALAAIAVPLVPFLACGARLDAIVAGWLDPPPAPAALAVFEVGVLAADLLLPVPSSMVTTLGGASLGIVAGTVCAWAGMTAGSLAGWWLGRRTAGRALKRIRPEDRAAVAREERRLGPLLVVVTRPLPLIAEAVALFAGAAGMPLGRFLAAAAGGNLAIAFAWSLAGAVGREAEALQWVLWASLAVPAAFALVAVRPAGGRQPLPSAAPGDVTAAGPRSP